jgi:hypothetical protein
MQGRMELVASSSNPCVPRRYRGLRLWQRHRPLFFSRVFSCLVLCVTFNGRWSTSFNLSVGERRIKRFQDPCHMHVTDKVKKKDIFIAVTCSSDDPRQMQHVSYSRFRCGDPGESFRKGYYCIVCWKLASRWNGVFLFTGNKQILVGVRQG